MRKLATFVFVLVGVAYPFIVYFGGERASPLVLGLVLGALWLLRAPALLRQPGGRWMLVLALGYCAVLGLGNNDALLRWYPSLICLLLLAIFALSLRYGPPIVERIARVSDPDLPPAAVVYTRKVTWVWIAFFAFNGSCSALLAAWGPLSWWTLYNGVIAYVAMGALIAVEWLCRRRLRRRINNTLIGTHP